MKSAICKIEMITLEDDEQSSEILAEMKKLCEKYPGINFIHSNTDDKTEILNTSNKSTFADLFKEMYDLCIENGWGDPYNYSRAREIYLAIILGHEVSKTYSGADAIDDSGECEYKTTITEIIKGTYNGISVQPTWEQQELYLVEDKIGKYPNHYFARFDGAEIVEVWKISSDDILGLLFPKLEKEWKRKIRGSYKDPRLSSSITKTEIYNYGTKIYGN